MGEILSHRTNSEPWETIEILKYSKAANVIAEQIHEEKMQIQY